MDKYNDKAAELLPCLGKYRCPPELPSCYACQRRSIVAAELRRMGSMSEAYDLTVAQLRLDNARQALAVLRAEIERLNAQSEKSPL